MNSEKTCGTCLAFIFSENDVNGWCPYKGQEPGKEDQKNPTPVKATDLGCGNWDNDGQE
jgi:hypothetical protein